MENLTEFKTRVIEYLSGLTAFEEAAAVAAFPDKQRVFPIKEPVITVEVSEVELVPAGLGGYLGGDSPAYGASALVTLRFGLYAAKAESCGTLYESLCNALFDAEWMRVSKVGCARCEYDAKTAAYLLPVTASLKAAWVVPRQQQRLFNEIEIKDVKI